jgi:hypothetical protein
MDLERLPPRRTMGKKEAVRRLLHSAIRMVGTNEDPFAIDLLVNSADKLLIDLAKHAGKSLAGDFTKYIKPEAQ